MTEFLGTLLWVRLIHSYMPKYFIYCRKSTEAEDRQVLSIESQKRELIKTFVEKEGLDIVEILEESYSAKAPGRKIFNSMMQRIEKGEADSIIAWHPDRLARNSVDGGKIIYLLDMGKIKDLKFSTFTFENSPQGLFMLNIIFGQSKYYVDSLRENVKRGNKTKLENGWLPGKPPIGYLNDKTQNIIVKDPERFNIVKKMWDLMLEGGYNPPQILEIANNEWGLRTPKTKKRGCKPLSRSNIYDLFNNPFYCGLIVRNGEIYKGRHAPMISQRDFETVQKLLGKNSKPRRRTHSFAFTGLIKCKECGCFITASEHFNQYGKKYNYYHCTKKKRDITCSQSHIQEDELERQIVEFLSKLIIPDCFVEWALNYYKRECDKFIETHKDIQKSLEKALQKNENQVKELVKMRYRELLSDEEFLKEKKELLEEQAILKRKIDNPKKPKRLVERSKEFFNFTNKAKTKFEKGDDNTKKTILKTIGLNFYLKDKKLLITAKKPFLILEKHLPALKKEIQRFEPQILGLNKLNFEPSFTQNPVWWALADTIRTFFLEEANCSPIFESD